MDGFVLFCSASFRDENLTLLRLEYFGEFSSVTSLE